jgi:hypothetical protein
MRVLVCGSRSFNDYQLLERTLETLPITTIIEGEARGADTLARRYGVGRGLDVIPFKALWDKHGKAAGAIRNTEMLTKGRPDIVVAFWDGESRGTRNMIEQAQRAGVRTDIVIGEDYWLGWEFDPECVCYRCIKWQGV